MSLCFCALVIMGSSTEGVGVDKGLAWINTMPVGWVKEKTFDGAASIALPLFKRLETAK